MRAIFISYRRDDSEGQAGRLYDDLARTFGDSSVFMDVAAIEPGLDFRKVIDHNVASCGVLLAVIGPGWLDAKDETGQRRLDNPMDFVRLETASALKRDIPVVPVLVRGARMPRADQLPPDLGELAYRNGLELTHARWESDVEVLVKAMHRHIKEEAAAMEPTVRPAAAPPRPAQSVAAAVPVAPAKKQGGLIAAGLVAAAAIAAFGLFMWMHKSPTPSAERAPVTVITPPQSQPQQPVVSPPAKAAEQVAPSEPTKTASAPRSVIRRSPEPASSTSPVSNASAQTREPIAPAPAVTTPAVSAPATTNTASPDSSKVAANAPPPAAASTPAATTPATTTPAASYPSAAPMVQSNAVNPNLPRFAVGHYGSTVQDYCVGWMYIDTSGVHYQAISGTHTWHTFNFPLNQIKEVKRNAFMFSMNQAFHLRMSDGEVFNFSQLDPNSMRFLNPDSLISAVRTAAGR